MKSIVSSICVCVLLAQIAYAGSCGSNGVSIVYLNNDTNKPTTSTSGGDTSQPDQGHVDSSSNHKHSVGLYYVRYRMPGQKNWHKGKVTVDQGTNQKLDIRVKVREKEGHEWKNVYVDLYYSENRWFSRSHDQLIGTKVIKTLDSKEKESRYFYNIDISDLDVGHHYYFADIRFGNDHNISSRSDKTEYVCVEVQDVNHPPRGYVDRANCSVISGWADDEDTTSPLNVHIYDGSVFLVNLYADDYRSDVGSRGFTYVIPDSFKDGTVHNYRVFAINEPQGQNPLLTNGNFAMSCGDNGAMPTTRFYNSKHGSHFYSVNPLDQTKIPGKFQGWENHGTSFNAFLHPQDDTVPLYTCWTGSTHEYSLDSSLLGQYKPCKENPWRMFDVYPDDGDSRKPVYLMYNSSLDSFILSNGLNDAYYLQDHHGFAFVSNDPLFWAPKGLKEIDNAPRDYPNDTITPISLETSRDETERKSFNQASFLLLQ